MKGTLAGKHPYVLYYLAAAMRPRMLMTVDVEGKLLPVSVRVGQAIDTVAQVPGAPLHHPHHCSDHNRSVHMTLHAACQSTHRDVAGAITRASAWMSLRAPDM